MTISISLVGLVDCIAGQCDAAFAEGHPLEGCFHVRSGHIKYSQKHGGSSNINGEVNQKSARAVALRIGRLIEPGSRRHFC